MANKTNGVQHRRITTRMKKKRMIEALEQSLGVVTTAARIADVGARTHYEWLEKDAKYAQEVEHIQNTALDFAESKLHSRIKDGDTTAIIFFLKTKGKSRGYVERVELEEVKERPIFEGIDLSDAQEVDYEEIEDASKNNSPAKNQ